MEQLILFQELTRIVNFLNATRFNVELPLQTESGQKNSHMEKTCIHGKNTIFLRSAIGLHWTEMLLTPKVGFGRTK